MHASIPVAGGLATATSVRCVLIAYCAQSLAWPLGGRCLALEVCIPPWPGYFAVAAACHKLVQQLGVAVAVYRIHAAESKFVTHCFVISSRLVAIFGRKTDVRGNYFLVTRKRQMSR